ncbi:uracil-DNA glycosylase [Heliobacterium chlorum]|uniref:Uracil-DNA glycosylase n=1 Tax=Heliobacterium chlorum TaxID=2698 RepID=A0ABR7T668_HELCL|nr:uracil-DNA glycosylase [Heliobacterium chlorum]MBC9786151.1 uracil-DNA glycosylase [Heliobacterium chlorum]
MDNRKKNPVQCHRCTHYYVTWDPTFPRGCRLLGFKTEKIPSAVVYESCGTPCEGFQPKEPRGK